MTHSTRLTILSALSLGLMACGGAKLGGGKEGAAQAAFQASQPAGRSHDQTTQALLNKALASGAATLGIVVDCAKHGTATLGLDLSGGSNTSPDGSIAYSIKYAQCNEDGHNEYDGTVASTLQFAYDPSLKTLAFITTMKGKLTISGDVSDSIDSDLTMRMDLTAVDTNTGNVQVVLDGTIKTSDGTYTYSHETLDITAGVLPHG